MTSPLNTAGLYRLLSFLSPAFPVGAFTYSHGLEQVIEEEGVSDPKSLEKWLTDILKFGAGHNDALLLRETMRRANEGDKSSLLELIDLGLALQPSSERHLETSAQGTAFANAIGQAWTPDTENTAGVLLANLLKQGAVERWPYPVAVGLTAAAWDIPEEAAVTGFLHAFASNIISAAIRAVPLGQNQGQRVLAAMEPVIAHICEETAAQGLEDLGSSTLLADIASMNHETKYSRLFRS